MTIVITSVSLLLLLQIWLLSFRKIWPNFYRDRFITVFFNDTVIVIVIPCRPQNRTENVRKYDDIPVQKLVLLLMSRLS